MPEFELLNLFIISDSPLALLPDELPAVAAAAAVAFACRVSRAISTALFAINSLFNLYQDKFTIVNIDQNKFGFLVWNGFGGICNDNVLRN